MSRHLEFRPDLNECVLEDRPLMAPVVPTLPWLLVTGAGGFISLGGGVGGGSLGNLAPLAGPPVMILGGLGSLYSTGIAGVGAASMIQGTLFSYYGNGYGQAPSGPGGSVGIGSGANTGTGGGSVARAPSAGYGASVNSGYGTSLSALNSYGMGPSMSALGQTTASGAEAANPGQAPAGSETTPPVETAPPRSQGTSNAGGPRLGVDVRPQDNLLKGGIFKTTPAGPGGPGR